MRVTVVPLNDDNYGYLVESETSKNAVFVDVSNQPEKVIALVKEREVNLKMVLSTHHHWDHAGGNSVVLAAFPETLICGSRLDNVEACNKMLEDGEVFSFDDINITAIVTPG